MVLELLDSSAGKEQSKRKFLAGGDVLASMYIWRKDALKIKRLNGSSRGKRSVLNVPV